MVHYDSQMCILQYFGVKNPLSDQVVLLNPTQLITDHHRIAYVYLIGTCMKIGKSFGIYGLKGHALDIALPRTELRHTLSYNIRSLRLP